MSVSRPAPECRRRITEISAAALAILAVDPVRDVAWTVTDDHIGRYGVASPEGAEAAALVARTEGIFLDPVFGAKAMAG